jgi:hypothetical protein
MDDEVTYLLGPRAVRATAEQRLPGEPEPKCFLTNLMLLGCALEITMLRFSAS